MFRLSAKFALGLTFVFSCALWASNGYMPLGTGARSSGMAGVGVAYPQDSFAAASNPAGMAWIGTRLDADLGLIYTRARLHRKNIISGETFRTFDPTHKPLSVIGDLGFNKQFNDGPFSFGLSAYTQGVIHIHYTDAFTSGVGGSTPVQFIYNSYIFAPTFAYQITECNAIGISLNVGLQTLFVHGFDGIELPLSDSPDHFTNQGTDFAGGVGGSIGWCYKSKRWGTGFAYHSKTYMSPFSRYKGLVADHGHFPLPSKVSAGLAWNVTDDFTAALDVQYIFWSDVPFLTNPYSLDRHFGAKNGTGFNWNNQTVMKIGLSYAVSETFTLRGGYSLSSKLRQNEGTYYMNKYSFCNTRQHATIGFTWFFGCNELSASYVHAFKDVLQSTEEGVLQYREIVDSQDKVEIAYGRRF